MDLILRNATLVDGSGSPGRPGDLGVLEGRIAALGIVDARGGEEIDVAGAVVAPGFIDVHTHYDAQALWDPLLTPSLFHGVTTVIAGNCGFTLAPLSDDPEDIDYLLRMLSRVEGMPLASLREAVKPDWRTFGEYLDRIDGKLALNTAFMVGHSALRRTVMGERAVSEPATPDDIAKMQTLLRNSIAEGGMGFSTSVSSTHSDYEDRPVPSRWAEREEIVELSRVAGEFPGTWLEIVLQFGAFSEPQYSLMTDMSLAAGRAVNWNLIVPSKANEANIKTQLHSSDYARARGAQVYGLVGTMTPKAILSFVTGYLLDTIPGWMDVIALPRDQRLAALADPKVQDKMRAGLDQLSPQSTMRGFKRIDDLRIENATLPHNKKWMGKTIGDYAASTGKDPFDAFLALVIEEKLQLAFSPEAIGNDPESWRIRADAWRDDRCIVGGSDAGAHLDMLNTFALATEFLGDGVRNRKLLSVEEAVRLMTSVPADRFGLTGRGRLEAGACADIVVFDPDKIASQPFMMKSDLPGNEPRVYAGAVGVPHVIVNGVPVVRDGVPTGRASGRVLRSGRDTYTVPN